MRSANLYPTRRIGHSTRDVGGLCGGGGHRASGTAEHAFLVYDHAITRSRAWFRFTLTWTDATTGEARTRAGMQLYRVEGGKLAETWLTLLKLGSAWPDTAAQEHWTDDRV